MFLKKLNENTIAYKVFTSWPVMLIQVIVAAIAFHLHKPIVTLFFMVSLMILMLLLCKDMTPLFLPIVLASMAVLANYAGVPSDFNAVFPAAFVLVALLLVRPFIFRVKWRQCKMLIPTILVAFAVTLGGVGYLSAGQYFKIIPMYHVLGLGVGMVLMYIYMMHYTLSDNVHKPTQTLTKSMFFIGLFGILMIFPVAIEMIIKKSLYVVQWSNNLSTILILTMPFSFYLATRCKKMGIAFYLFGLLQYLAIVCTMSRGGVGFGSVTVFISVIATIIVSKKRDRIIYTAVTVGLGIAAIIVLFTQKEILDYIVNSMNISPNETRFGLFKTAIDNFLNYPIFGTGLAFIGEYYYPQGWAIYFYHSTPFQIIGSLGTLGIIAYGVQFIYRIKVCLARPSRFNVLATVAFIGFELMALVNPGDFAPLPHMMMLTTVFVVMEINNANRVESDDMMFASIAAGNWHEYRQIAMRRRKNEPPTYIEK